MSLPLVSVAVPAYNHAAFLDACLESVRNQSYPRLELVVVDDGSTDATLAVAERFAVEEKKRVLVLLTDMTAYADALKEVGISLDRVPSTRGYLGDLYS